MLKYFASLLGLSVVCWSGICEDNMFSHVMLGRAAGGMVLDSANWDPIDGGDWNHYQYDTKGRVTRNNATSFAEVTADSLSWTNSAGSWGVRYFPGGYRSIWNDGFGTLYRDSMWRSGDTIKWFRSEIYEQDPEKRTLKLGYSSGDSYLYRYLNLDTPAADTVKLDCKETVSHCECELDRIPVVDFKRVKTGVVFADTFWQASSVQRTLYFHSVTGTAIRPNSNRMLRPGSMHFFDLLGRKEQPLAHSWNAN